MDIVTGIAVIALVFQFLELWLTYRTYQLARKSDVTSIL